MDSSIYENNASSMTSICLKAIRPGTPAVLQSRCLQTFKTVAKFNRLKKLLLIGFGRSLLIFTFVAVSNVPGALDIKEKTFFSPLMRTI